MLLIEPQCRSESLGSKTETCITKGSNAAMNRQILIQFAEHEADEIQLEEATLLLIRELRDSGLDPSTPHTDKTLTPNGVKGPDMVALGALLVTFSRSATVEKLVTVLRGWLGRGPAGRSVKLSIGDRTIELTDATAQQQDILVAEFVRLLPQE